MKRNAMVHIQALGSYTPARSMHNDEISTFLDTSDEWILSHTGIRTRYIAAPDESTSDLAYKAARAALEGLSVDDRSIDVVIVATSTPDYPGFPSTACVLQNKLHINATAFDISAACSGFIYGLEVGRAMILSGSAQRVLLVCSETFSRIVDWKDRSTCVLFGDGAAATVLGASPDDTRGIVDSVLNADSSNYTTLTLGDPPTNGDPFNCPNEVARAYLKMDGKKVYLFAVNSLVETVAQLLQRNALTMDDIRWVVPHQANVRIIGAACKRAGYDQSKFYINIDRYANVSAASIPLALDEMHTKGLLKRGDKILTIGFGSGLTYGGNLLVW